MARPTLEPPTITATPLQAPPQLPPPAPDAPRTCRVAANNDSNGMKLAIGALVVLGLVLTLLIAIFASVSARSSVYRAPSAQQASS